jgi:hypothetical protein
MKIAYIFTRTLRGPVPMRRGNGLAEITIFRWWKLIPVETPFGPDGWALHLLVFCNGVMADFMHQSHQGVFAIGWHHGLFFEFVPRTTTHRLWVFPFIRYEKGAIK